MERFESKERMPDVEVLLATREDAEGIRDVQRDTWLATYPNKELGITKQDIEAKNWGSTRVDLWRSIALENDPNKRLWVAKEGKRIVGFCAALTNDAENKLTAIYIHPEYQGKGVGSKLMQEYLSWTDKGKESIVEVVKYNSKAIEFYKRFGFDGEEEVPPGSEPDLPSGKNIPEIRMHRKAEFIE